jgi:putative methyltransferase (TIGR04325 family)
MKPMLRDLARHWLPPAALGALSRFLGRGTVFEGGFASWEEAARDSEGYDSASILEKVRYGIEQVRSGAASFERDSVLFHEPDDNWPLLAGLFWAATRAGGKLGVLDFGGSLGSTYFQYRRYLRTIPQLQWCVVEQPHFVSEGRSAIQEPGLEFHGSVEDAAAAHAPTVILLSSVLQYLEHPHEILQQLTLTAANVMVIDRTPFTEQSHDIIVRQVVPRSIYPASYPMHVFSLSRFLDSVSTDWACVARHQSPEGATRSTTGQAFSFRGLILERRT